MFASPSRRILLEKKSLHSWLLDWANLLFQGTIIPWLQVGVIAAGLTWCFPGSANQIQLSPGVAFILCFVGVDYLYYWNHRLLHVKGLWALHLVHHSAEQMDVFTTSRNTLWTSLLIIYLWVNGLMLYLLSDPTPYLAAMTLTFSLDLWRHSPAHPPRWVAIPLQTFLILPKDHGWHHSRTVYDINFGANLNLWDRLHGTWHSSEEPPTELGVHTELALWAKLLWPFERKTSSAR